MRSAAALTLLDLSGFDPGAANGPRELFALTALYCLVPIFLWLVSVWLIWNFPITPERQMEVRAAIERLAHLDPPDDARAAPGGRWILALRARLVAP